MHRPVPGTSAGLVDMIDKDTDIEVRHQVARAIGFGGFDDKVAGSALREDGGRRRPQRRGARAHPRRHASTPRRKRGRHVRRLPKEALDELKDVYYRSFGYWSDEDFDKGRLYRWVDTAEAHRAHHA